MASDSISEHLFFWGGMPPDPPSISMLRRTMERIYRCPRYPYALLLRG